MGEAIICRYRRQTVAGRQIGDQFYPQIGEGVGRQNEPAIRRMRETLEGGFDISGGANRDDTRLYPEGRRRSLDRAHEEFGLRGGVGIEHDADTGEAWRNLLEEVKPFVANGELIRAEAGEVAARPRHIGNKTLRDRIGDLNTTGSVVVAC